MTDFCRGAQLTGTSTNKSHIACELTSPNPKPPRQESDASIAEDDKGEELHLPIAEGDESEDEESDSPSTEGDEVWDKDKELNALIWKGGDLESIMGDLDHLAEWFESLPPDSPRLLDAKTFDTPEGLH